MTRPPRFWRIAAVLFVLVNIAGAIYAVAQDEQMHAEGHLALLAITFIGYLIMRGPAKRKPDHPQEKIADARIEYLQQSVDAMALELERLGEAQRFNEKLIAEQKKATDGSNLPPAAG